MPPGSDPPRYSECPLRTKVVHGGRPAPQVNIAGDTPCGRTCRDLRSLVGFYPLASGFRSSNNCGTEFIRATDPARRRGGLRRASSAGSTETLPASPHSVPKESSIMRRIQTGLILLSAAGMLGAVALAETKVEIANVHLCCPGCVKAVHAAIKERRRGHGRLRPEGQDGDHYGSR